MSDIQPVLQIEIDRVVDGEAAPAEQRSLLRRLAESDDGWKRLALGFVEAQTWGTEIRSLTEPVNGKPVRRPELVTAPVPQTQPDPADNRSPGWVTVVLTASVMLVTGLLIGMEFGVDRISPGNIVSDVRPGTSEKPMPSNNSGDRNGFPIPAENIDAGNTKPKTEFVEFVLNEQPGRAQTVSVPIRSEGNLDQFLNSSASVLSPDLRHFLENRGHQFTEQRDLIPVELSDGRIALIPVRQVELQHMMNRFGQ